MLTEFNEGTVGGCFDHLKHIVALVTLPSLCRWEFELIKSDINKGPFFHLKAITDFPK